MAPCTWDATLLTCQWTGTRCRCPQVAPAAVQVPPPPPPPTFSFVRSLRLSEIPDACTSLSKIECPPLLGLTVVSSAGQSMNGNVQSCLNEQNIPNLNDYSGGRCFSAQQYGGDEYVLAFTTQISLSSPSLVAAVSIFWSQNFGACVPIITLFHGTSATTVVNRSGRNGYEDYPRKWIVQSFEPVYDVDIVQLQCAGYPGRAFFSIGGIRVHGFSNQPGAVLSGWTSSMFTTQYQNGYVEEFSSGGVVVGQPTTASSGGLTTGFSTTTAEPTAYAQPTPPSTTSQSAGDDPAACERHGWTQLSGRPSHCGLYVPRAETRAEALASCRDLGGDASLFAVLTTADQASAAALCPATSVATHCWIDLHRMAGTNDWRHEDGSAATPEILQFFRRGEPRSNGAEECVEITYDNHHWNDLPCGDRRHFLCHASVASLSPDSGSSNPWPSPQPTPAPSLIPSGAPSPAPTPTLPPGGRSCSDFQHCGQCADARQGTESQTPCRWCSVSESCHTPTEACEGGLAVTNALACPRPAPTPLTPAAISRPTTPLPTSKPTTVTLSSSDNSGPTNQGDATATNDMKGIVAAGEARPASCRRSAYLTRCLMSHWPL